MFTAGPALSEAQRLRQLDARFGNELSGFPAELSELTPVKGGRLLVDASGQQYVLTPGRVPGHAAEQLRADRLYRILGVSVPASRGYPDEHHAGNVVKLARVVDGSHDLATATKDEKQTQLWKRRAQAQLAAHALLENWSIFSEDDVRLRFDPALAETDRLKSWVVRAPGTLRYRVRGELKPDGLDAYPMGLWTLREGKNRAAAAVFAEVTWSQLLPQLRKQVERRDQLLDAVADDPDLHRVLASRLDTVAYLIEATRELKKAGLTEGDIDRALKASLTAERAGGARVPLADLAAVSSPSALESAQLARLNEAQRNALDLVGASAKRLSASALPKVLKELISTHGCTPAEAQRVVDYIRDHAEIHIYFHPEKLLPGGSNVISSFLTTGRYMNQFETMVSSGSLGPRAGSARDGWERRLFQGAYHDHALNPSERPKYGAMNVNGVTVPAAAGYGSAFLVLKPEVKARVTITPRDSSGARSDDVGTAEHGAHVLRELATEKKDVINLALGRPPPSYSFGYMETQIHGPVEFGKDVAKLVAPEGQRADWAPKYREFSRRFHVPLFWLDGTRLIAD